MGIIGDRESGSGGELTRPWVPAALSLLAYTIIAATIGREVLAQVGSMIANDPGDPLLTAAILKWNATHVPLSDAWYQFPIFYPTRDTLTFSEHLLGLYLIASPLYWITGDAVATYNIVLLLTYPLCGIAMYALMFRLTGSPAAAFLAGLSFAFAPYRVSQLPHIQMLATFWAPLALLGLHAYVETGRRRWLALYGAAWVLQGASNGYALVMFSILVGLWTLWFVVSSRKWHALSMIAVATAIAVLPLAPVLYKYTTVHSNFGFVRGYFEIRSFSADVAGLLCAPPALTFWGWVRVMCRPEGELFPGVALTLLSILGLAAMVVRSWRSELVRSGRVVTWFRRVLLLVAAVYTGVIILLLVSGPFMFDVGPLHVQASTFRKPVQVVALTVILALVLSPGVRTMARQSRTMSFYILATVVTWSLTLGPMTTFMGNLGVPGPYQLLLSLPGVNSLRVPARFWLMTTICLSVVAGLVVAEFLRARSRRATLLALSIIGIGLLGDGWIDRIQTATVPPRVPGAPALGGAVVLEVPPDTLFRDIQSVFRAVDGGWKSVNGYSGWGPSYYNPLIGAGRAEVDDVITPFRQFADLHVIVGQDAPRLRAVVERQPGVTQIAGDSSMLVYRLPKRELSPLPRPDGERLMPRELRSECATELLSEAIDGDESSLWQCALWDERGWLLVDLGDAQTVGSVVNNLGYFSWVYPGALHAETSTDGEVWSLAWSGSVRERSIRAAMADPKHLRIVLAFPPRQARFIRLRAGQGTPEAPWAIAELEVWSSSSESH
jgi:hypothetical protein